MKVFYENESEDENVTEKIFVKMIILNLIKIMLEEKSLFAKNFDDDDDCSSIFRENVFFNIYFFDIA